MTDHKTVSRDEWLTARKRLLEKEKALTHARDGLARERRELPWVRVEKRYVFEGPGGRETLADLFAAKSQLLVYHFMYDPSWEEACKSCSFWADGFDGAPVHLAHRDVSFAAISRAPLAKIEAYKRRMGWSFKWVSSLETDFNRDHGVTFTPEEVEAKSAHYNYATFEHATTEMPGISAFYRNAEGEIFHTYSCYGRGIELVNPTYQLLDLAPRGRDEDGLPYTMAWVRRHDEYTRPPAR